LRARRTGRSRLSCWGDLHCLRAFRSAGLKECSSCRTDYFKDLDLDVLIEGNLVDDESNGCLKAFPVAHDGQRVGDIDQRHCADDESTRSTSVSAFASRMRSCQSSDITPDGSCKASASWGIHG
jgi:hypothetical protein